MIRIEGVLSVCDSRITLKSRDTKDMMSDSSAKDSPSVGSGGRTRRAVGGGGGRVSSNIRDIQGMFLKADGEEAAVNFASPAKSSSRGVSAGTSES